jgi:hypothetical protein
MPQKQDPKLERSFLTRREYYRLIAEVRVLGSMIRELYMIHWGHSPETDSGEKEKLADQDRERFEKMFDEAVAHKYAAILEQIEDVSPALAAELDERSPEEIP